LAGFSGEEASYAKLQIRPCLNPLTSRLDR
jgi:hypothetical protein